MGKTFTAKRITVPMELFEKAMKKVEDGKFPGVRSFSGICEYALNKLLKEVETT